MKTPTMPFASSRSNPTRVVRNERSRAFTLVELLVVIGIIGILIGLILPGLAYARFRSKVTTCTSNFRQWAIASATYATDDRQGRLPSFELPTTTSALTNYSSLEPWFVALPMITNMAPYGVTARMWFCPTREQGWYAMDQSFRMWHGGRGITTAADLETYYRRDQKAAMAFPGMFWWVPRQLEGSTLVFPDAKLLRTRIPDPWPTKMEDASANVQPIASDWLLGQWDDNQKTVSSPGGGHRFGLKVRNNNAVFADGHVETRPWSAVKWQMIQGGGARGPYAYLY